MIILPSQSSAPSDEKKEEYKHRKTVWAWAATLLGVIGNIILSYGSSFGWLFSIAGMLVAIYACWNWTKYKGREPAWALWGILYPIGYLALVLLKDKNPAL